MGFHTADYDVYVFLGDPAFQPIWHWEKWLQLMPELTALLHVARGPASTRSTQFLANERETVKFGRIGWKEPDQQKWTHGSPRTLGSSPNWRFFNAELWAPAWTQCKSERSAPDVFMSIASQGAFVSTPSFEPAILLAVVSELSRRENLLVACVIGRLRELVNPKLVVHQRRPWGRSLAGGAFYSNSISDLHVTGGLFKAGRSHERPVDLDLFAESWELVR
jgi:hypothetical protein